MTTDATLKQRGEQYGTFKQQAGVQEILHEAVDAAYNHVSKNKYESLSASQRAALDMIIVKLARIINGNPNNADSWHDIGGYAELIAKELQGDII